MARAQRAHHCTTDAVDSVWRAAAAISCKSTTCSSLPRPQLMAKRAPLAAGTAARVTGSPSMMSCRWKIDLAAGKPLQTSWQQQRQSPGVQSMAATATVVAHSHMVWHCTICIH